MKIWLYQSLATKGEAIQTLPVSFVTAHLLSSFPQALDLLLFPSPAHQLQPLRTSKRLHHLRPIWPMARATSAGPQPCDQPTPLVRLGMWTWTRSNDLRFRGPGFYSLWPLTGQVPSPTWALVFSSNKRPLEFSRHCKLC